MQTFWIKSMCKRNLHKGHPEIKLWMDLKLWTEATIRLKCKLYLTYSHIMMLGFQSFIRLQNYLFAVSHLSLSLKKYARLD
ncbi:unnamed protein product [Blepharisma stoltei]|uniref:Uncharacterized protein n=1 Tax=Blepharisma stoltei TaxID=1481888 RepID=A0AAU9JAQ2_9CILI|nr:unnamed protein product [Blepharisma stoltei]